VIAGEGVDLNAIEEELSKQCQSLPRGEFAAKALTHSFIVHAHDMLEVSSVAQVHPCILSSTKNKVKSKRENKLSVEINTDVRLIYAYVFIYVLR